MRFFRRIVLVFVLLPAILLGLEAGYFIWSLRGETGLQEAAVIVAFQGRDNRAAEAYRLLELSYAPNLVISPATEKRLQVYEKKHVPSLPFGRIVEDKSRTTLENAVYTKKMLDEHEFRSAILVTSWDHMPRSFLLLRLLNSGSSIRVQARTVETGTLNITNWYRHSLGWEMVYNEMVEFWGSLMELMEYGLNGKLPTEAPGKSTLAGRLKQLLFFEIDL